MRKPTYDLIGDIAILKFDRETSKNEKIKFAEEFLSKEKHIKTVLEKTDRTKGRLRTIKTKFLSGENKKITTHLENSCRFKLNVDETYFSPRLSNERKLLAEEITKKGTKTKNKILVLFAGVAPFPIVIAHFLRTSKKKAILVSNELNRKASKFAEENVKLNRLQDYIKVVQGDAKKIDILVKKNKLPTKYDFIMMARPNLKETFLKETLKVAKKGTIIYYHGFGTQEKVLEEVNKDLKKAKAKTSKIEIRKAGEIAPHEYRWLISFMIK